MKSFQAERYVSSANAAGKIVFMYAEVQNKTLPYTKLIQATKPKIKYYQITKEKHRENSARHIP